MHRTIVFLAAFFAVVVLSATSYAGQWQPPKTHAQLQRAVYAANKQETRMATLEQRFACAVVAGKHHRAFAIARERDAVLKKYVRSYVGRFRQFTDSLPAFMGGFDIGKRYPIIDPKGSIDRYVANPSAADPCRIALRVPIEKSVVKTAGR